MKNTSPSSLLTSARFLQWGIIQYGLTLLAAGSVLADSEVIYRNNFGNNTGGTIALNIYDSQLNTGIGWSVLRSQNGANVIDVSSTGDARVGVNNAVGRPSNLSNINAPISLSDTNGIVFLSNGLGATAIFDALFYTTQYAIDRSLYEIDNFQWYANQSDGAGTTQRLAVQVSGNWYVAASIVPSVGNFGNFSTSATLQTVNFTTAQWNLLTATIGSPFEVGASAVPLPEGTISGFGIYIDNGNVANNYSRFDTFTINATAIPVPEPGSALLFGSGLLGMLFWNSRRRKG